MSEHVVDRIIVNDGVSIAVRSFGPPDATPVVMLHGFPENGATWQPLADHLGDVRVIAPDLRGHGLSDAPRRVSAYRVDRLVDDVLALIDLVGGPVDIVGHDWGGALVWSLTDRHPDAVRTATVIAAPHPSALRTSLRRNADQRRRSRYMLYAQLPIVPEWYLGRSDARMMHQWFRAMHSPDEIAAYDACWSRHGVRRGMINFYRALLRCRDPHESRPRHHRSSGPGLLLLTGSADPLFGLDVFDASLRRISCAEHVVLDGVGHSPHRQAIETTATHLRTHWTRASR
ncbi:MAG: alpha/beta fold hydrolase [Actinomycetota bacterium]